MGRKANFSAKERNECKSSLIGMLEKSPFIEIACNKVGITRMTLIRWQKTDKDFSEDIQKAINLSREKINDLAESKLIGKIQEGNMTAISFWLRHNNPIYGKSGVSVKIEPESKTLIIIPSNGRDCIDYKRKSKRKRDSFYNSLAGRNHLRNSGSEKK